MYVLGKDAREKAAKAVLVLRAALGALHCPSCLHVSCRGTEWGHPGAGPSLGLWGKARESSALCFKWISKGISVDFNNVDYCFTSVKKTYFGYE